MLTRSGKRLAAACASPVQQQRRKKQKQTVEEDGAEVKSETLAKILAWPVCLVCQEPPVRPVQACCSCRDHVVCLECLRNLANLGPRMNVLRRRGIPVMREPSNKENGLSPKEQLMNARVACPLGCLHGHKASVYDLLQANPTDPRFMYGKDGALLRKKPKESQVCEHCDEHVGEQRIAANMHHLVCPARKVECAFCSELFVPGRQVEHLRTCASIPCVFCEEHSRHVHTYHSLRTHMAVLHGINDAASLLQEALCVGSEHFVEACLEHSGQLMRVRRPHWPAEAGMVVHRPCQYDVVYMTRWLASCRSAFDHNALPASAERYVAEVRQRSGPATRKDLQDLQREAELLEAFVGEDDAMERFRGCNSLHVPLSHARVMTYLFLRALWAWFVHTLKTGSPGLMGPDTPAKLESFLLDKHDHATLAWFVHETEALY